MIPDLEQRALAINVDASYAVTAPAGSGKTGLLTQRVLHLLGHVEQPEQILCITFTRKAAQEMRDRILQALLAAYRGEIGADSHQQQTLSLATQALARDSEQRWQLLANPHRLNINTIDGLCAQLAKRLPVTAGIGGGLTISENPEVLYQAAVRRLLHQYDSDATLKPSLSNILLHLDTDSQRLERLLTDILANREQWLRLLLSRSHDLSEFRDQLQRSLHAVTHDSLEVLHAHLATWQAELLELYRFSSAQLKQLDTAKDLPAAFDTLPNTTADSLHAWRALTAWMLTKDGTWRKSLTKNQGFPSANKEPEKS